MAIETGFDIPAIEISTFELTLVGDSPLIVHAWSEKAKKEILDKQMKVAKTKVRSIRNPAADFIDSLYWLTKKPAEPTMEAFYQAVAEGGGVWLSLCCVQGGGCLCRLPDRCDEKQDHSQLCLPYQW